MLERLLLRQGTIWLLVEQERKTVNLLMAAAAAAAEEVDIEEASEQRLNENPVNQGGR